MRILDSMKRAAASNGSASARDNLARLNGNLAKLNGNLTAVDTQRAIAAYKMAALDSVGQGWH